MLCVFEMPLYAQWRRSTLNFLLYSVRAAGGIVENADSNKLPLNCGMFHTYLSRQPVCSVTNHDKFGSGRQIVSVNLVQIFYGDRQLFIAKSTYLI
jgi:hypothetical protein